MIVVAVKPQSVRREVTAEHRERFLEMLPQIRRQALVASRWLRAEAKEEFLQAVIASAFVAFARLAELGNMDLAFPTALARYGVLHVRGGRSAGTQLNVHDVSSRYAQVAQGIQVQRLDRRYANGQWKEVLVEDHRAGPAETAAARIDVDEWFGSLPVRNRRIALALALGGATSDVAEEYAISWSRISQLRQELRCSWLDFQGELPEVLRVVQDRSLLARTRETVAPVNRRSERNGTRELRGGSSPFA